MSSVVAMKIGMAVSQLVATSWLRSKSPELGRNATVGELIRARLPDVLQQKTASRQFDKLADEVAASIDPFLEHDALPRNEREAAALAVASALESLVTNSPEALFAVDLDPALLSRRCRTPEYRVHLAMLSDAAGVYCNVLLDEACERAVQVFMNLPAFDSRAAREMLQRERQMMERIEDAIRRIPTYLPGGTVEAFSSNYVRSIVRVLDRVQLFGVSLNEQRLVRYELSVAYLSLNVAESVIDEQADDTALSPELRVEEMLRSGRRIIVRGEAGSGKTTLLQWVAVRTAKQDFGFYEDDCVPIFVRLRHYADSALPAPEQMIESILSNLKGEMPAGWVHDLMRSGRAIVLIDGIDELSERQRGRVDKWISDLVIEFPNSRYVVTSRPPAVGERWLAGLDFVTYDLLPMGLLDIERFVGKWHEAIDEYDSLEQEPLFEAQLVAAIQGSRSLASLASNPLLCALLCALNRDRRTKLPEDRMELYRVALDMLLDRRDRERDFPPNELLPRRVKEIVLQDIAFWMIRNEASNVSVSSAEARVSIKLANLRGVDLSPSQLLHHLLLRSGLLREPTDGKIDFIHRTFQEYLGAKQAVEGQDIRLLVSRGHEDQWREVIILAAGHATPSQCNKLLTALVERGDREKRHRHKLHLLAIACLETAVELDQRVADRLSQVLRALIPPKNIGEAQDLASAGELVSSLLSESTKTRRSVVADVASIRALSLVGGETSLASISNFSGEIRPKVIKELLHAWSSFDPFKYASKVLVDVPICIDVEDTAGVPWTQYDIPVLHVADPQLLDGLPKLKRLTGLVCDVPVDTDVLSILGKCSKLEYLVLRHCVADLEDYSALGNLDRMKGLSVSVEGDFVGRQVSGLKFLQELAVATRAEGNIVLDELGRLTSLKNLLLSGGRVTTPRVDDIQSIEELTLISCAGRLLDLSIFGSSPLRSLYLEDVSTSGLENLNRVRHLGLAKTGAYSLSALPPDASLEILWIGPEGNLRSLAGIEQVSSVQTLAIDRCARLTDVSLLKEVRGLTGIYISQCPVGDISIFGQMRQLSEVTLDGCGVGEPGVSTLRKAGFTVSNSNGRIVGKRRIRARSPKISE